MRSVIFSLIKSEKIIRSLSCKNPFCAIVKGLRFSKASEEQIPTAICEETTKRVNCHENGNLPLFYIEKDTRNGVLYAPFACVLMAQREGFEPSVPLRGTHDFQSCALGRSAISAKLPYYFIVFYSFCQRFLRAHSRKLFIMGSLSYVRADESPSEKFPG